MRVHGGSVVAKPLVPLYLSNEIESKSCAVRSTKFSVFFERCENSPAPKRCYSGEKPDSKLTPSIIMTYIMNNFLELCIHVFINMSQRS
jgi:hypothetical protein